MLNAEIAQQNKGERVQLVAEGVLSCMMCPVIERGIQPPETTSLFELQTWGLE